MQLKPISQQVVCIVGASSGIGRQAALDFAKRKAKVVVSARNEVGLKSLVDEIESKVGEAKAITADVANFDQVKAIADFTIEQYGRIDTWVHAAATGVLAPFEEITIEEFQRVMDVTFMGQVYAVKAALPYLKQQGGALIHISSMEGKRALPLQSPYSAAKHALQGFLESLRVELQHDNIPISVTSILPAVINTPFYNHVLTKLGVKPTGIPPYYSPQIVADAILYVAENPTREYIVGDVGRILDVLERLSPELVDAILATVGFSGQKTNQPKSADAPNNLYAPMEGYNQVRGDFNELEIPSISDWLEMNPPLKWGALAASLAAITFNK
ncbi:SDR family oxidoreductase [Rivularia sp. UHCC 0363]|uniref:SDR family oxidoreductase n=1 Tax=Rivularia sp. UHCC 0363 TaxID=3110244 RepID=UPI002B1F2EBE|nr:SDR family oxidoreductase [Rivularia sp. UHCC 0363]MEA5598517.1 SDR family oxidoreductase [Rivularia sp. UHCC 0363]